MIFVKEIKDLTEIEIPKELMSFASNNLISFVEMLFQKEKFLFIRINSTAFEDINTKRTLWNLIRPHRKMLPNEMIDEMKQVYPKGEKYTLFPIEFW